MANLRHFFSTKSFAEICTLQATGFHPVWDTILRSCVKNYFFECLTSILEKLSYRRYHTLMYKKSQSFPPSLMALTA
jgi:hypothetical protein